jgi:hypothetical protein
LIKKRAEINGCYRRYETEWAIAKILYETATTLLPLDVFAKIGSVLDQLRKFVQQQQTDRAIFNYESASSQAQRWHAANVCIVGNMVQLAVTLFGKETWKLNFGVFEKGHPATLEAFELSLRNDFPSTGNKSASVLLNGAEWIQASAD